MKRMPLSVLIVVLACCMVSDPVVAQNEGGEIVPFVGQSRTVGAIRHALAVMPWEDQSSVGTEVCFEVLGQEHVFEFVELRGLSLTGSSYASVNAASSIPGTMFSGATWIRIPLPGQHTITDTEICTAWWSMTVTGALEKHTVCTQFGGGCSSSAVIAKHKRAVEAAQEVFRPTNPPPSSESSVLGGSTPSRMTKCGVRPRTR